MIKNKGMTLLEIMVTVAVIAILSAIAIPTYEQHLLKSRRAAVIADLVKIQLELERTYNSVENTYDTGLVEAGSCSFCQTNSSDYKIAITSSNESPYIITAEPQGRQQKDNCGTLSLNAQGIGASTSTNQKCW